MFGMEELQEHMHKLESLFEAQKKFAVIKKHQIDYFLRGIDSARSLLDGHKVNFIHIDPEHFNDEQSESVSLPMPVKSEPVSKIPTKQTYGIAFVVDDEPEIADNLSSILEESGIVVHKFYDTKNLLHSFETIRPDVVIADIKMPNLCGLEMLDEIKAISPDTPVIFISAHTSKDVMLEALMHGAYAFIETPYEDLRVSTICSNAIKKNKTLALLDKSINYILYQFSNLDQYLKDQGKDNIRLNLKAELQIILEHKKSLKSF